MNMIFIFDSVKVMSKAFNGKTDCTEKWYQTPYSIQKIPADKIKVHLTSAFGFRMFLDLKFYLISY